jgi:hypothetical protein
MSERASLSPHHRELMLSLAYLGGLTYALALRLLPCYSARTLQRDLSDLRRLGDVEKHAIYRTGPKGRPVKQYDVWTLTDKGHSYILHKASDQYPTKPTRLRTKRVMPHDLLAVKTIVALVERARQEGLSGLFVQFETRLNPDERRPIPDAVVIMQFGGGFGRTDIVPWTKDPAVEDESRSRFVIEVDFLTETLSVIAGKARAYRAAFENDAWLDWWAEQFGPQPIVIWVVADKNGDPQSALSRLASIFRAWHLEWPNGYWVGTTEHRMEQEAWAVYAAETWAWYRLTTLRTERRYVTSTERHRRPAASPQPVAPPTGCAPHGPVGREPPPAAANTMYLAPASAADVARPALTAAPFSHPALSSDASVVVPPGATTALGQRAASRPVVGDKSTDRSPAEHHSSPIARFPVRAVYTPPSILEEVQWNCERLALLVRDGYDEVRYVITRLLEILGIIWLVRTCARLIIWFFLDEGYTVVGALIGMLVCLGVIGWAGHQMYRTYRADPLFSFARHVPPPTAAALMSPVPTTWPQSNELPPPAVEPSLRPMCGVARVASEGLNLRETPGGRVLTVLYRDEQVVLLCDVQRFGVSTWAHVRAGQYEGWVNERYLNPTEPGS